MSIGCRNVAFAARKRGSSSRDSESPGLAGLQIQIFRFLRTTVVFWIPWSHWSIDAGKTKRLYDSDAPFYDRV